MESLFAGILVVLTKPLGLYLVQVLEPGGRTWLDPVLRPVDRRKDDQYQEGCLSIPGIFEEGVKRSHAVRVDYTDLQGDTRSIEAEDYLARIFQHENDHLDGVFFLDRLPPEVT